MRVIFLTHYYPPEAGAPQARISALAAGLRALGWDVCVHTGFPHYPVGHIMAPYRNRPLLRESGAGGERVVRSAVYPTANRGFARRLLNHVSLCLSSLVTAPAAGPADVVVAESPPLFTAAAGVQYARLKRAPLVVNVADRWPASAVELGAVQDRRAIRAAERLERWIYRRAATVTVPTHGLHEALEAEPETAGRVVRLPPAVDTARFDKLVPPTPHQGPLRVLYAGTVGLAHGITTLLDAAQRAGPGVVEVTIAGGGAEADRLAADVPSNVRFLGLVTPDAVPRLYGQSDAGLVLLRDKPVLASALPTKLLECMAAARPVILSARGEAASFIERSYAGITVPPEDPAALGEAFSRFQQDPELRLRLGAAGRAVAEAQFDRAQSVRDWAELLQRVTLSARDS